MSAGPPSVAAHEQASWSWRLLLALGLMAVCSGVALALFAADSMLLAPVLAVVLTALAWPFLMRDVHRAMLFAAFMAAPVDVAKALISPTDKFYLSDAPGLSLTPFDLAIFAWGGLWLARRLMVERRGLRLSRIDLAALGLLVWIWVSAAGSPAGGLALATALTYTKFVAMFLILSHALRERRDWQAIITASWIVLMLQIGHVAAQVLTRSPLALPGAKLPDTQSVLALGESSAFRPMGFFNHPNALADYLLLILPALACLLMLGAHRVGPRVRLAAGLGLIGGGWALAMTLSRGGWAAFGLALIVCVSVYRRVGLIDGRQLRRGLIGLVCALGVLIIAMPSLVLRVTGPDSRSLESRTLLAEQAFEMLRDRPLEGVGFGGYNRSSMDYTPSGFAYVSEDYHKVLRQLVVHNYYLLLATELGVPAMIWFVGIFVALILRLRPLRSWQDPGRFALAVGLAASIAGNLLFFASDNYYADIRAQMLWVVSGLLQALCLARDENRVAAAVRSQGRG